MMKCSNCNKEIPENSAFCRFCGEKQKMVNTLVNSEKEKLVKRYRDTGNTSIALSVLGLVITVVLSYFGDEGSLESAIITGVISLIFLAPFYYYGQKLKDGITNLEKSKNISKWMAVYTAIFIAVNLLAGSIGWLWLFVLYYYYKAYKETKETLATK